VGLRSITASFGTYFGAETHVPRSDVAVAVAVAVPVAVNALAGRRDEPLFVDAHQGGLFGTSMAGGNAAPWVAWYGPVEAKTRGLESHVDEAA
jgi:hypothetical protein